MIEMVSGITSTKLATLRRFDQLKANQVEASSRLASDTTAILGTSDPDQIAFITKPLKDFRMVQALSGANTVGTLAFLPPSQYASLEDRYYKSGTPVALDRAGSPTAGFNILRPGQTPDGYYGGDKALVQKRTKLLTAGSDYPDIYVYAPPTVRAEPRDYVLQEDERYDGGFYPGSIHFGVERPYGTTFPTDSDGNYVFNGSPFSNEGWDGTVHSVAYNTDFAPVIESLDPNYFILPDTRLPGENIVIRLIGQNLDGLGWVMIGPYQPSYYQGFGTFDGQGLSGSYGYHVDFGTECWINLPQKMQPGVYDVYAIGGDGQIGVLQQSFTVYAEGDGP